MESKTDDVGAEKRGGRIRRKRDSSGGWNIKFQSIAKVEKTLTTKYLVEKKSKPLQLVPFTDFFAIQSAIEYFFIRSKKNTQLGFFFLRPKKKF